MAGSAAAEQGNARAQTAWAACGCMAWVSLSTAKLAASRFPEERRAMECRRPRTDLGRLYLCWSGSGQKAPPHGGVPMVFRERGSTRIVPMPSTARAPSMPAARARPERHGGRSVVVNQKAAEAKTVAAAINGDMVRACTPEGRWRCQQNIHARRPAQVVPPRAADQGIATPSVRVSLARSGRRDWRSGSTLQPCPRR